MYSTMPRTALYAFISIDDSIKSYFWESNSVCLNELPSYFLALTAKPGEICAPFHENTELQEISWPSWYYVQ